MAVSQATGKCLSPSEVPTKRLISGETPQDVKKTVSVNAVMYARTPEFGLKGVAGI